MHAKLDLWRRVKVARSRCSLVVTSTHYRAEFEWLNDVYGKSERYGHRWLHRSDAAFMLSTSDGPNDWDAVDITLV